ncbi:helix-turn-helix domain-containing protein [Filimonas effusa]|uniref:Transcriptional regulator n=1 Tax=Filimonas effusa TaxID=2508721 RepID=A0A4Q1D853_9BACT|nr:helix-turn-helix transcriptional regulator [Filimonas effusa]RXK85370.1 transcriptional regulator [Filimonas effusa]
MPVVINLDVVLAKRKMSLSRLSEKTGISLVNLSLLKNNKIKAIRFSTLEAICVALGCKPGEIIDYLSDEEYNALLANENS